MPFQDILGHDREMSILKRALANDRVPHSFLFSGPDGCGKRLTAISLAKSVNCSASKDNPSLIKEGERGFKDDFCGICQNCRNIENLSYTDVFLVEPREPESKGGGVDPIAGTIKIDAVRDIQQRLSYKAVRGGKKVCIVDGAEKMNKETQNAFLKTLEEPPADSIIILIMSDCATLLSTILSRCQRINFRPLPQNILIEMLKQKIGVSEDTAILIASLSSGSIGKALNLDMEFVLGQRKKSIEILSHLSLTDTEKLFSQAEDISKRDKPVELLEFLKIWYRDIAVLKEGREDLVVNSDLLPVLRQQAGGQTFERLISGFKMIHQAQIDMLPPRYANKQLTVENLFMQLAS
ncbi:MAG: DNA polymerase III subunit delta' [Deltaproteobacteria bacterium]|nr:DNA polymerase III subunit delta' [Deltaproteobacteria bacterium]